MMSAFHLTTFWRPQGHLGRHLSILVKLSNINENCGLSNYWSYASTSFSARPCPKRPTTNYFLHLKYTPGDPDSKTIQKLGDMWYYFRQTS